MEASPFPHSSLHPLRVQGSYPRSAKHTRISAGRRGDNDGDHQGRLVDKNMFELRRRIREIKMREGEEGPPAHWMEWEKQYYKEYASDVCEIVGMLQIMLMNARPATALGLFALVAVSLPTTMVMIIGNLIAAARGVHLGS